MALWGSFCCALGVFALAARAAQAMLLPVQNLTEVMGSELQLASSSSHHAAEEELPVCVQGQALPRLYILGPPKCGTTSMAADLVAAGAVFMTPGVKESHFFDPLCGALMGKYDYNTSCPAPTDEVKEFLLKLVYKRSCSEKTGTLLEATPNEVLPGLPPLLASLYGDQARRVGFVVVYREPLGRLHSQWWMIYNKAEKRGQEGASTVSGTFVDSFDGYLAIQDHRLQQYQAQGYEGLEEDRSMLFVYQSLYSLHLPAWLENFAADQLVIFPMMYYLNSTQSRDAAIEVLASRFGATLSAAKLHGQDLVEKMVGTHPDLSDEVNTTVVKHWYDNYFRPDLRQLAGLLAESVPSGLFLGGYPGQGGSGDAAASEMLAYLCEALTCLD